MNGNLLSNQNAFGGREVLRRSVVAVLIVVALMLLAAGIVLWRGAPASPASSQGTEALAAAEVSAAVNPELRVAQRYGTAQRSLAYEADRNDPAFLAANPELSIAARQLVKQTETGDGALLAENPELSVFHRYADETTSE